MDKNILSRNENKIVNKINIPSNWTAPKITDPSSIQKGDMPGDQIKIGHEHIEKAELAFPKLLEILATILDAHPHQKAVIAVCGGSGVGKSETGSLISYYLNNIGIGSYILSGDNYPHRIPKHNDMERLRIFRESGIKGLVSQGEYTDARNVILKELQESGNDSNAELISEYPWLLVYQNAGKAGLKNYLGTTNEIDFCEVNKIISGFKSGVSNIMLKRMGREESELWYDTVDFSNINVIIIEWTHGNNQNLIGVDIPILLNSTPKETLEHRKLRNRDGGTDSPFTTMLLAIEQDLLISQAQNAKIIVTKQADIISYEKFVSLMKYE